MQGISKFKHTNKFYTHGELKVESILINPMQLNLVSFFIYKFTYSSFGLFS